MRARISTDVEDPLWDRFLWSLPDGHHVQGTRWAKLRASEDWSVIRVLVEEGDALVAGAQILVQPVGAGLRLGRVPRGPVFAAFTEPAAELLLSSLETVCRRHRLTGVVVQPPDQATGLVELLSSKGFRPSPISISLPATTQVDLRLPEEEIRSRMSKSHRRALRQALDSGLMARWGDHRDLPRFYRLHRESSRRHSFHAHSPAYFERLWDLFSTDDGVHLLMVEDDGEPIASQLVLSFGQRAVAKYGGWTGAHPKKRPNHLMDWVTIQWAKAAGLLWYDLEGITREEAMAALEGKRKELPPGAATYKLGWGGDVVTFPGAYVQVPNPVIRSVFLRGAPLLKAMRARLRGSRPRLWTAASSRSDDRL